ncbi:hypothetical protein AVEN_182232-1 [Araneus ventricosus]|uniref:Uncharacterized protein n=1 Tax=Araneus ventricosus TaxID=182803 RepID=A0A4Y2MQI5_ARAVE|nr:hypothetical protein AVEN_54265-1 [Araneus ventricosus]GBN28863.1 hypothetical protein AVEN_182232-1 [Araneus ventricosus]
MLTWSQFQDQRVPISKSNSIEELPCKQVWCTLNPLGSNNLLLVRCKGWRRCVGSGVVLTIRPWFNPMSPIPPQTAHSTEAGLGRFWAPG